MNSTRRHALAAVLTAVAVVVPGQGPAQAGAVAEMFKKVKGSVAVVRTTESERIPGTAGDAVSVEGMGSGVLVDPEGLVLTAAHVVQVAEQIEVEFPGGEKIGARVSGSVPGADLALLRLDRPPTRATVAKVGDSSLAEVGDEIFIVGAPLGLTHTLTVGNISARRSQKMLYGGLMEAEFLQTDAAINPGNSGGPMFNMAGEVIGIVSHMLSRAGGYEGLGFVASSNMARRLLLEERSFWSGLEGYLLAEDLAKIFNLPQPAGILVQKVASKSPAAALGLRPGSVPAEIAGEPLLLGGDVILEVQGMRISDPGAPDKIRKTLSSLVPGEKITVAVLRDGRRLELLGAVRP